MERQLAFRILFLATQVRGQLQKFLDKKKIVVLGATVAIITISQLT